jgi:hypothetical protein
MSLASAISEATGMLRTNTVVSDRDTGHLHGYDGHAVTLSSVRQEF